MYCRAGKQGKTGGGWGKTLDLFWIGGFLSHKKKTRRGGRERAQKKKWWELPHPGLGGGPEGRKTYVTERIWRVHAKRHYAWDPVHSHMENPGVAQSE